MDNSFLKLYRNDFQSAVMNDNIDAWETKFSGFVQQRPNETFTQITNCERTIAFGGNIEATIIDICGNVIRILENGINFFYHEFTDIKGIGQIKFKFGRLGVDYGEQLLYLRLKHTTSDNVWFSAGFMITFDDDQLTTKFFYKNESYFRGISYDVVNDFQSIRLACFLSDKDKVYDKEEIIVSSGDRHSSRMVITPVHQYAMYQCDFFTWDRLVTLLAHDIIYANGYRIGDKPNIIKTQRIPDSNVFDLTFDGSPTEEKLSPSFSLSDRLPLGLYGFDDLPTFIFANFTQDIVIGAGNLYVFNAADELIATYTQVDLVLDGFNGFKIPSFGGLIDTADDYYIKFDEGLVLSEFGQTISVSNTTDWRFTVSDGDFDENDFAPTDENEFFTN